MDKTRYREERTVDMAATPAVGESKGASGFVGYHPSKTNGNPSQNSLFGGDNIQARKILDARNGLIFCPANVACGGHQ